MLRNEQIYSKLSVADITRSGETLLQYTLVQKMTVITNCSSAEVINDLIGNWKTNVQYHSKKSFRKILENSQTARVIDSAVSRNTNLQLQKHQQYEWGCGLWKKLSRGRLKLFCKKTIPGILRQNSSKDKAF